MEWSPCKGKKNNHLHLSIVLTVLRPEMDQSFTMFETCVADKRNNTRTEGAFHIQLAIQ